jgi:hypothetical protein
MDKEILKKRRGDAKNLQYMDRIFVELKKGLAEMMYDEEMKDIWVLKNQRTKKVPLCNLLDSPPFYF